MFQFLVAGLVILYLLRVTALFVFLLIMFKFQGMNFQWLPLIGAAFLASALDMLPIVGHFIAVPVLLLCVWKIAECELFPDASFTVGLSYACMRCLGWILLAYLTGPHFGNSHGDYADSTNSPSAAIVETTNQSPVAETAPAPSVSTDKVAAKISVQGVSRVGNDAMVTIQYGKKSYVISLGEGTTISTDQGMTAVHFVKASDKDVTLSIKGQDVKYALK